MQTPALADPDHFARGLDAPVLSSDAGGWRSGLVRRWKGGAGDIRQPPIDHHYVVLHLGGAKHVTRSGAGRTVSAHVAEGALTLVPAGTRYDWRTVGPIDFAHLYVHPARLGGLVAARYGRDPSAVALDEEIGFEDPLLAQLIREMLAQAGEASVDAHAYLDALFDAALAQLAHKHSTLGPPVRIARHALAPTRLRRVLDHVEAHLGEPIRLDDLAGAAGFSRFHFSRAFHRAMGLSPLAYVAERRIDVAKRLLKTSDLPLSEIGRRVGLGGASGFSAVFRRTVGQTPSDFRRQL